MIGHLSWGYYYCVVFSGHNYLSPTPSACLVTHIVQVAQSRDKLQHEQQQIISNGRISYMINIVHALQRTGSELKPAGSTEVGLLGPHSKGSAASFKKLSRFFGEDPPRVETLESFLEDLGYMHLLPVRCGS